MRGRLACILLALRGPALRTFAQEGGGDAPAGDGPPEITGSVEISAVGVIETQLSDEEHGKAFGVLGPVEVGRRGLFRVRAQRLVIWLDPEADQRIFQLLEGIRAEDQVVPLWAVRAVYAEGGRVPAILQAGGRTFRCASFYFDLRAWTGVIVDAEVRVPWPAEDPRGPEGLLPPVVLRAERFRARGPGAWEGEDVTAFASEYVDPQISVELESIRLRDRGTEAVLRRIRDAAGRDPGVPRAEIEALLDELEQAADSTAGKSWRFEGVRARVSGLSVLRWNEFDLEGDDVLDLRVQVEAGTRGQLGSGGRVGLGVRGRPLGVLAGFGYYPDRGPLFDLETVLDADGGRFTGRSFGVYLYDHGQDFGVEPSTRNRWWIQNRYRWEIGGGWRLDGEYSDLSDSRWLRTIDEGEYREGKEQETLLYLRGRGDVGYLTATGKVRSIGFATVVEERPRLAAALPTWTLLRLGEDARGGPIELQVAGGIEVADLRYRAGETDPAGDFSTGRVDVDPRLFLAVPIGPVRVVPFVEGRVTNYEQSLTGGALTRFAATAGARADTQLRRAWASLRHVVNFSVEYANQFEVSEAADAFFPMDDVDRISPYEEVALRWRNRLQRRAADGGWEEFLSLELYAAWFPDERQPLGGTGPGWFEADLEWAVLPSLSIEARTSVDLDHGTIETGSVEAWYRVHARLRVMGGYRHLRGDSDVLTGLVDYEIDRRWSLRFGSRVDLLGGEALDQEFAIRRLGRTAVYGLRFRYNPGNEGFGIGFTADLLAAFRRSQARSDRQYKGQYGWSDRPFEPLQSVP